MTKHKKPIPPAVLIVIGAGMILMSAFIDIEKLAFFIFIGAILIVYGFIKILNATKAAIPKQNHQNTIHNNQQHFNHQSNQPHHNRPHHNSQAFQEPNQHSAHHTNRSYHGPAHTGNPHHHVTHRQNASIICSSCGTHLKASCKFCPNCGQRL